jgi:hypothetical protein
MMNTGRLTAKLRQRRNSREFERALRTASPAMQQELLAAAARQTMFNH